MFTIMDKRDDDALLDAYNLVRERLEKNKAESGRIEDALQQTVLNVLKARGRVRDLPGYTLRTVYRELRRLARLEWLSEQRETTAERFGLQPDLGSEAQPYRRVLVLELLSKLEETDQILVRLYAEQYPWEYIGPMVGLSPQSAKQRCYRLLRRLREMTTQEPKRLAASHRMKRG